MSAAAFGQSQSLGDIARENRDKKAENSIAQPKVFTNSTLPKDPDAATNAASGAPSATTTAPSSSSTSPFSDKTSAEKPATFPEERATPPHAARPRSAQQRSVQQQLAEQRAAQQRLDEKRAAAQWRKKILQQEQTVAGLRMRVDMLKASIRFVDPNRYGTGSASDYYAGLNYNRGEARQLQRLARMQQELDEQRRKLEGMQEAARHAGMHTLVYDP